MTIHLARKNGVASDRSFDKSVWPPPPKSKPRDEQDRLARRACGPSRWGGSHRDFIPLPRNVREQFSM